MPTLKKMAWSSAVLAALAGALPSALAQSNAPQARTFYLQAGAGEHGASALGVGLTLPWRWSHALGSGAVTGHWDLYLGGHRVHPNYHAGQRRMHLWAISAGPSLRWRGAQGASPWFVEVGTALMLHNRRYHSADRLFGTRYNFASHLGVGRNWGAQQQHELSLRVQHISNAGIKHPNPGENLLLLRYAQRF